MRFDVGLKTETSCPTPSLNNSICGFANDYFQLQFILFAISFCCLHKSMEHPKPSWPSMCVGESPPPAARASFPPQVRPTRMCMAMLSFINSGDQMLLARLARHYRMVILSPSFLAALSFGTMQWVGPLAPPFVPPGFRAAAQGYPMAPLQRRWWARNITVHLAAPARFQPLAHEGYIQSRSLVRLLLSILRCPRHRTRLKSAFARMQITPTKTFMSGLPLSLLGTIPQPLQLQLPPPQRPP